jgi:hypothetical protein
MKIEDSEIAEVLGEYLRRDPTPESLRRALLRMGFDEYDETRSAMCTWFAMSRSRWLKFLASMGLEEVKGPVKMREAK